MPLLAHLRQGAVAGRPGSRTHATRRILRARGIGQSQHARWYERRAYLHGAHERTLPSRDWPLPFSPGTPLPLPLPSASGSASSNGLGAVALRLGLADAVDGPASAAWRYHSTWFGSPGG